MADIRADIKAQNDLSKRIQKRLLDSPGHQLVQVVLEPGYQRVVLSCSCGTWEWRWRPETPAGLAQALGAYDGHLDDVEELAAGKVATAQASQKLGQKLGHFSVPIELPDEDPCSTPVGKGQSGHVGQVGQNGHLWS